MQSPLQKKRRAYLPKIPNILSSMGEACFEAETTKTPLKQLRHIFPKTFHTPLYKIKRGKGKQKALKIGVFFSGGPAAGGHNVIAAMFDANVHLLGFLNGAKGLLQNQYVEIESVDLFRNQGGFDLIGTGREKIEKEEDLLSSLQTCEKHQLDGLVVIGGDDSNTNAAFLAEFFLSHGCLTRVVGVPKTIDGDLRSDEIEISFGFDSACKTYAELIGNLSQDALSTQKYYHFVKLMGRAASHVVLECALLTQPNLALISEERRSLPTILEDLCSLIIDRFDMAKSYGVILIPEGLVETLPEVQNVLQHSSISRDPHGNLDLSKVKMEDWLFEAVEKELQKRNFKGKFQYQSHSFGYEGRSCLPSNFDANYTYALGKLAVLAVSEGLTGVICSIQHLHQPCEKWEMKMVPLVQLMHFEDRLGKQKPVIQKKLVDLKSKPFLNFSAKREGWRLEDQYLIPGPIQFCSDPEIADTPPQILLDLLRH